MDYREKLEVPDQVGTIEPDSESDKSVNQNDDNSNDERDIFLTRLSNGRSIAHQDSFIVMPQGNINTIYADERVDRDSITVPMISIVESETQSQLSNFDVPEHNLMAGNSSTELDIVTSYPNNAIATESSTLEEWAKQSIHHEIKQSFASPAATLSEPPALERVTVFPEVEEQASTQFHKQHSISTHSSKGKLLTTNTQQLASPIDELDIPIAPSLDSAVGAIELATSLGPSISRLSSFQEVGNPTTYETVMNGSIPRYLIQQRNNTSIGRKIESGYSTMPLSGRRRITLRLEEDVLNKQQKTKSTRFQNGLLRHIRQRSTDIVFGNGRRGNSMSAINILDTLNEDHLGVNQFYTQVSRGKVVVSWFDGTSSMDLHEHVRKCVIRKLVQSQGFSTDIDLDDLRLIDETVDPPEEIVLSPVVPDGMNFVCRFSIRNHQVKDGTSSPLSDYSVIRPPVSPGAAPSPPNERDIFAGFNSHQLALINKKLNSSLIDHGQRSTRKLKKSEYVSNKRHAKELQMKNLSDSFRKSSEENEDTNVTQVEVDLSDNKDNEQKQKDETDETDSKAMTDDDDEDTMLHSEDPIESRFREIFHLILTERRKSNALLREKVKNEKRQVIFFVANYLVLFLAVIAISAEIQARAPAWLRMVENELLKAHNCGATQEALFECVTRGDFAGLLASIGIFFSRSLATRRIFLFGFETPKKLWTVVYECLVSAICWSFSHLFIRRGLNPDTRERFIQKHWKDTVYGGLAGFFAAFLKMVLKNLIPQEVVEDALRDRRLKILSWLPGLLSYE